MCLLVKRHSYIEESAKKTPLFYRSSSQVEANINQSFYLPNYRRNRYVAFFASHCVLLFIRMQVEQLIPNKRKNESVHYKLDKIIQNTLIYNDSIDS